MSDWITADAATAEVGMTVSESQLTAAEGDIFEYMRWTPIFGQDLSSGDLASHQRTQLGRAIAWQAAYRELHPPVQAVTDMAGGGVASISYGDFSESYDGSESSAGLPQILGRAAQILARAGLMRLAGKTQRWGRSTEPEIIAIIP